MIGNGIFFFAHDGVFTCSSSVTVLLVFIMEYLHVHDWLRCFVFVFAHDEVFTCSCSVTVLSVFMMEYLHVHDQ